MKLLRRSRFRARSFYLTLDKKLLVCREVRATYLYVLAASLALHGLIAGSVALSSSWASRPMLLPPRVEKSPTLSLIYPSRCR